MAYDGAAQNTKALNFMDLDFSPVDLDTALDTIAARASLGAPFVYVATPNVDHMVKLSAEPGRRPLYDNAWLTLNDSRILEALATRAGLALPAVPGADLTERLFDNVIDRHEPIVIIGGDGESVAELTLRFRLTDVRWHEAPRNLKQNPEAIVAAAAFAAKQDARFTFICVGAPQQEMIAYAISARGDATGVGLCVGAALDFLSGRVNRAPQVLRSVGMEWAFRLFSEPGRLWRRYLVDGPKVFALFSAWRSAMAAASAA
jgi:N-acetylglucosaminyldiphosphoundecaprenol N-acetyl-beta-D-mannosaminyltransferase